MQVEDTLVLTPSQWPSRLEQEGRQEGRQLVNRLWAGHCRATGRRESGVSGEVQRGFEEAEATKTRGDGRFKRT